MSDTAFARTRRIIVVEDDHAVRLLLARSLQQAGYDVVAVTDAPEALDAVQQHGLPTLFILDFGLPSMTGAVLAERLKRMGDVPIIFLTGNTSKEDTVQVLERYAEDYITKPFHLEEVMARVNRVIKRIGDHALEAARIRVDEHLWVDFPNSRIEREGELISLTPIENGILYLLYANRGKPVSAQTLLERVWKDETVFEDTVRVHLSRLRNKLQGDAKDRGYITNERGTGYTFHVPE